MAATNDAKSKSATPEKPKKRAAPIFKKKKPKVRTYPKREAGEKKADPDRRRWHALRRNERVRRVDRPCWHVMPGTVHTADLRGMSDQHQVPNSGRRAESWAWSRWMIDECICETRDSLRSSVAPISFMVNSS